MTIFSAKIDLSGVRLGPLKTDLGPHSVGPVLFTSAEHIIIPAIRQKLKLNKSIFTGNLFRNIGARIAVDGTDAAVDIGSIGVDYGLDIEKGRKPFTPDRRKMVDWARRKLKSKNPEATAMHVIKNIQRRGLKEKPYIIPVWNKKKHQFADDFTARMKAKLRT